MVDQLKCKKIWQVVRFGVSSTCRIFRRIIHVFLCSFFIHWIIGLFKQGSNDVGSGVRVPDFKLKMITWLISKGRGWGRGQRDTTFIFACAVTSVRNVLSPSSLSQIIFDQGLREVPFLGIQIPSPFPRFPRWNQILPKHPLLPPPSQPTSVALPGLCFGHSFPLSPGYPFWHSLSQCF